MHFPAMAVYAVVYPWTRQVDRQHVSSGALAGGIVGMGSLSAECTADIAQALEKCATAALISETHMTGQNRVTGFRAITKLDARE